ncbi:spore germination gerac [Lucifera butyrica]|uniref:Spore germination gerac n=1 Tax=Lucifera butyrica TaxID=1351585 RepID=A0A498R822_9FIRM|nr:Ger(x)C family spore germination protein [Lucifera butyrica]VBB07664.1 spore germination gerac [Lucifera butyrica]
MLLPRVLILLFLVLLSPVLSGCNGSKETDEVSYIIAIGIDAADNGMLEVSYRLASPRALAGSSESSASSGGKTSEIISVTAPSLAEARNLLEASLSRSVLLSHNKSFVISEQLARRGLQEVIGPLLRYREFRGSMYIIITREKAKDFLLKNHSQIEALPSRWIESLMLEAGESGYLLPTRLHEFYRSLKSGSGAPYAAYAAINPPLTDVGIPSVPKPPPEKGQQYIAGNVPKEGDTPAMVLGTAVFDGTRMVGVLTSDETRMLSILKDEYRSGFITISDPLAPSYTININLRNGKKPDIRVTFQNGIPVIHIDLLLEGEVSSITSGINYESSPYTSILEEHISALFQEQMANMLHHTQKLQADVFDFGRYTRSQYQTYAEFRASHWNALYPRAQIHVTVKTTLRRFGLMWQTKPFDAFSNIQ